MFYYLFSKFKRLTFVGSAWSFGFFIPATTANDLQLRKIFYPRSYPLHYFLILILEKEPVFPFSMLSDKQGNYWYHFYIVFGMTRCLSGIEPGTSRTRCSIVHTQIVISWKILISIHLDFSKRSVQSLAVCTI